MIQPEKDVRPSLYTETTTTARGTPHQCCQAKSLLKNMSKIRRPNTKQLRQRSLYATIESAGIAWLQHLCTLGTRKLWTHTNALALRLPLRKGAAEILCFKNPRKPTVAPFCDMPMVQPNRAKAKHTVLCACATGAAPSRYLTSSYADSYAGVSYACGSTSYDAYASYRLASSLLLGY